MEVDEYFERSEFYRKDRQTKALILDILTQIVGEIWDEPSQESVQMAKKIVTLTKLINS